MITVYGIHNCDTTQKALKWLAAQGIPHHFHNYKESGIDEATIRKWLEVLPLGKVLNSRSTTFRELGAAAKAAQEDPAAAIKLMREHNSVIKRPLWDFGNGQFFAGWNEEAVKAIIDKG